MCTSTLAVHKHSLLVTCAVLLLPPRNIQRANPGLACSLTLQVHMSVLLGVLAERGRVLLGVMLPLNGRPVLCSLRAGGLFARLQNRSSAPASSTAPSQQACIPDKTRTQHRSLMAKKLGDGCCQGFPEDLVLSVAEAVEAEVAAKAGASTATYTSKSAAARGRYV